MRVAEVMTPDPQTVSPEDSLRHAAELMSELDIGVLPVCDGDRLLGVITDRDITVRATSAGQAPDTTKVATVMTEDVRYCYEDDEVEEAEEVMQEAQVRRLPVITPAGHLVGIVSLGDLATSEAGGVRATLDEICKPPEPDDE